MTSRPNPKVRRDWERTRAEFEAEERADAQRRLARIRDAETKRALEGAQAGFPTTPVASRRARTLREAYLDRIEKDGEYIEPGEFADDYGRERWSVPAVLLGLGWLVYIAVITFQTPYSLPAHLLWFALQAIIFFFIWAMVVALPLQGWGASRWTKHYDAAVADYQAYFRWVDHVERENAKIARELCVCGFRNSIHDATCPALRLN